jgi:hypothetical protein
MSLTVTPDRRGNPVVAGQNRREERRRGMNDPRHELTAEVQRLICAYIRSGGFPEVAAEARGIPRRVFRRWMRFGAAQRPVEKYRAFRQAVMEAEAEARLVAESDVRQRSPVAWLKFGPGRARKGKSGWAGTVRPLPEERPQTAGDSVQEFIPVLLEALAPYPEARAALAEALEKKKVGRLSGEEMAEVTEEGGDKEKREMQRTCNEPASNL